MIGFFLAKNENIGVPSAVEKSRTSAFQSQDQMLSFFSGLKKNNHYENESTSQLSRSLWSQSQSRCCLCLSIKTQMSAAFLPDKLLSRKHQTMRVCIYMYMYVYVCIYIHIYIYIHVCICVCIYIYTQVHTYICTYTNTQIHAKYIHSCA